MPPISVVIPTLNRPKYVVDTVNKLESQIREVSAECVVVDQSSKDIAREVRRALSVFSFLKYLHLGTPSLQSARNVALRQCSAQIILFLDDDIIPGDGLVRAHLESYTSVQIGCVAGRIIEENRKVENTSRLGSRVTFWGRAYRNYDGETMAFVDAPGGGNMSFRMETLREVGSFDTEYVGNAVLEETDYAYRLKRCGYKVLFQPKALVRHLAAPSGGCRIDKPELMEYYNFRNTTRFFLKNKMKVFFPLFLIVSLVTFIKRTVKHIRLREAIELYVRAILAGLRSYRLSR